MRYAIHSISEDYPCVYDWPADCFIQCGGLKNHFFFEAFPRNPDTYIRKESKKSIQEAEAAAWITYQSYLSCKSNHDDPNNFDRKGYKNGLGFCKSCNMSKAIFEPSEICFQCGKNTYYSQDNLDRWWCEKCSENMPKELWSKTKRIFHKVHEEIEINKENIEEVLTKMSEILSL